jgi:GT2 family glycosyltransferase
MTGTTIDVIVCTFNRARSLTTLLHALAGQTVPPDSFRILVVDDGSADETPDLCRNMQRTMPNLHYERLPRNTGLSNARNTGVLKSKAPLIAFTDDDCIPRPDWLERMIAALATSPVVAGAVETPTDDFWKLCHNIAQFHPFLAGRKARRVRFIAGANMGFRRDVLETVGGFEADRNIAEDMELVLRAGRAGFHPWFTPEPVVLHNPDRTGFGQILRYSARHARSTVHLRRTYRADTGTPFFVLTTWFLALFSPAIAALTTAKMCLSDLGTFRRHPAVLPVVYILKVAWCFGACRGLLDRKGP